MLEKSPTPQTCADCAHYCQHYVFYCGHYHKIDYGHCVSPRLRKRMADAPVCQHFDPLTPREDLPRERKTRSPNS